MLEQGPGHEIEAVAVLGEHHPAAILLLSEDPLDFLVDHPCGFVGVVTGVHEVIAQEHLTLRAPGHGPDCVGHPPLRAHHASGQLGGAHQVVRRAGRDDLEHELLGDAAAEHDHESVEHVVLAVDVTLLFGQAAS